MILFLPACSADGEKPSEEIATLVCASFQPFGVDSELRLAIETFNESHADVQIEIRDYWGDDYDQALQGRQRLLTEIAAGNGPDILDVGFNCGKVAMLPYRQMGIRGYLEDLWPYIENDPELGRGAVLEAPLKASEINGSLYLVFDRFKIGTLTGPERLVGGRTSWTLAELWAVFETMPQDSTVLDYSYEKTDVLSLLLSMTLDSYIDWDIGVCSFDSEDFQMMMEFVDRFPDEVPWPSDIAVNLEVLDRRRSGMQMLHCINVCSPFDVQTADFIFEEPTAFIGYPVKDGRMGSAFVPADVRLAISSTCKNKEAAWELVRQTLLAKYDNERAVRRIVGDKLGIPINFADYQMMNEVFMNSDEDPAITALRFIDGSEYNYHTVTEDEFRRFEDLLYGADKISLGDGTIAAIVKDAAGPYFAGDRTLDETVALIQNRVSLYVNENR